MASSFDRIAGYLAVEPVRVTAFLRLPLIGWAFWSGSGRSTNGCPRVYVGMFRLYAAAALRSTVTGPENCRPTSTSTARFDAMGGSMDIDSAIGRGTQVTATSPPEHD